MFAYCLNCPTMNSDPTGKWSWVGAILGGITSAVGAVMNGGTLSDVFVETVIGFVSGGCTSLVGSLVCMFVESAYTIITADPSDPVYLSLLLSIFAGQITGDNLNWLMKGVLDQDTINAFDWVFGTGVDLVVSGIDVLLQEVYSNDDVADVPNVPVTSTTSNPSTPQPSTNTGFGVGFSSSGGGGRGLVCVCVH